MAHDPGTMPIVGQDVPGLRTRDLRGLRPPRLLVLDARAADDRGRVPLSEWGGNDMSAERERTLGTESYILLALFVVWCCFFMGKACGRW